MKNGLILNLSFPKSEKDEKDELLLKNTEISQNEERMKQELRKETQENSEMYETIQSLTKQQSELEKRIKERDYQFDGYQQQINSVDDLKNEISDKNKVIFETQPASYKLHK